MQHVSPAIWNIEESEHASTRQEFFFKVSRHQHDAFITECISWKFQEKTLTHLMIRKNVLQNLEACIDLWTFEWADKNINRINITSIVRGDIPKWDTELEANRADNFKNSNYFNLSIIYYFTCNALSYHNEKHSFH